MPFTLLNPRPAACDFPRQSGPQGAGHRPGHPAHPLGRCRRLPALEPLQAGAAAGPDGGGHAAGDDADCRGIGDAPEALCPPGAVEHVPGPGECPALVVVGEPMSYRRMAKTVQ
jgi:hypothetical protein